MKQHDKLIQLLIISDQNSKINQLLSNLRNKGVTLKAEGLTSIAKVQEQFKRQHWDLIVYFENVSIPAKTVLKNLKQLDTDIPLLCISSAESVLNTVELLKLGVRDVISESEQEKILFCIEREAHNYQLNKKNVRLELSLKELEKRHQLLLNSANNAFSYVRQGMHIYCNDSYAQVFSFPDTGSMMTTPLMDLVIPDDRFRLKQLLNQKGMIESKIVVKAKALDGQQFNVQMIFSPVDFNGKSCLQLCVKLPNSNTDYIRKIEKFQSQDLLTSLDNGTYFNRKVEAAIREAVKFNTISSILIIQLDKFVDITSVIGKPNANIVISDVSQFLQSSIKKPFSAARLSEHEFGIILFTGNPEEALELSDFIKTRINNHITATALPSLELSCSVGAAVINGNSLDADDLIAKARGNLNSHTKSLESTGNFNISCTTNTNKNSTTAPSTTNINSMLDYLHKALAENKFELLFQAIVNIKGADSECYEILTRMVDNDGKQIPPNAFIPLANLNGLGEKIDRLIILNAIKILKKSNAPLPRLIINLTSNSLVSLTFLPWLSKLLQKTRISSDLLLFQLSEIDIYNNLKPALAFCQGLAELNLRKTICHFGCALDPFEHLAKINPEYVKLDITIIRDILHTEPQKDIVRTMVGNLHRHKCLVVAPQVEEIEVLPLLWEVGIDYAQGYCLQAPSQEMNYEFTLEEEITLNAVQPH